MTIDTKKMLKNLLQKQFQINHIDLNLDVFSIQSIPKKIKAIISDKWSDKYLLDADYVLFVKGKITKKILSRLFKSINKAFGEDANLLSKGDIKMLPFKGSQEHAAEQPEDNAQAPEQEELSSEQPEDNAQAPEQEEQPKEGDALDEDEEGAIQMNQKEEPTIANIVFLKITIKK